MNHRGLERGAIVDDRVRVAAASVLGAVVGGLTGYLFFTDRGRHLRRQLEPAFEDLMHELGQFRGTVMKASGVASEGWKVLADAVRDRARESRASRATYTEPSQSQPF
jgi:membrane protein YqaA with SNARE-associated domain